MKEVHTKFVEKFYKTDRNGNKPTPMKHLVPRGELRFAVFEEVKVQKEQYYDLDENGNPPKPR